MKNKKFYTKNQIIKNLNLFPGEYEKALEEFKLESLKNKIPLKKRNKE